MDSFVLQPAFTVAGVDDQDIAPTQDRAAEPRPAPVEDPSGLYARFYPRLYGYARRFADPALAEDIVQEVFLRVLKYKNGDVASLPLQFLLTMTRNVALRMLQTRRREVEVASEAAGERGAPGRRHEEPALHASVPGLLERLPERQREAVELTTARGLSEHQASLAMNASRSAVSARRRTGLEHLRRVGTGRDGAEGHHAAPGRHAVA